MRLIRRALRDHRLFRAPAIRLRMLLHPRRRSGGVLFLMYHRVRPGHVAAFGRQLGWLRDAGELVGMADALAALSAPPDPELRICLTFDDGWADVARTVAPVLLAAKVPATAFVVTDRVGTPLHMGWDDLRRLRDAGITVGSHSVSHPRLASLSEAAAREELVQSRGLIAQRLGTPCHHFAAPFGQPHADYRPGRDPALARQAGYRSFFTTVPRRAAAGTDRFLLPRVRMEPDWGRDEIAYALWR